MKKNDELIVEIVDIGINGEGIGKVDGYTLFVKDAIMGDKAKVKITKPSKNYAYARLVEVMEPSKLRVEPACPVARSCGGCQIQEMSYESQLEFKKSKVENNIRRIGKVEDFKIHDTLGMEDPFRYRNKAQFPIRRSKDGRIIAGFYAGRTHSVIECEDCVIGISENKEILDIVIAHMEKYEIEPYDEDTHQGVVRHVLIRKGFKTGEIMVSIVVNGNKLKHSDRLVDQLVANINEIKDISINRNKEKTNVIMGEKTITLYGEGYITDYIGDVAFRISPLSFYQVNPVQTEVLYGKALEYAGLTGDEVVFDLYCGVGTISLFLAKSTKKVYGVEIVPEAIEDAKVNAKLNDIDNTEFYVGKAEEVIPKLYKEEGIKADVVVVDPPRKGCDEVLLETIVEMEPKRLVYVSCDSATLARDISFLKDRGFVLEEVQPVDMFPSSVHCEVVSILRKKN